MGGERAHHTDPGGLGLPTGVLLGELNLRPSGGLLGLEMLRLPLGLRDRALKIPLVQLRPTVGTSGTELREEE